MEASQTAAPGVASGDGAVPSGPFAGYSPHEHKPLVEYAALTALFNAAMAGALVAGRDRLPERVGAGDIALMGMASHKFSRLISKDRVTSFLRAPFTRFEEDAGPGEVSESSRGTGAQKAIGELLVCPYCLGQWVTGGYMAGLLFAPRVTRFLGAMYAALTVSDFLQLAYKAGQEQL